METSYGHLKSKVLNLKKLSSRSKNNFFYNAETPLALPQPRKPHIHEPSPKTYVLDKPETQT